MSKASEADIKDLYDRLKEAYSDQNLNRITAGIISLYRAGEFDRIKEITRLVSEYVDIYDDKVNRCFSKLIMTYHPDKAARYLKEIDQFRQSGQSAKLKELAHVFVVQDLESIQSTDRIDEDIDYHPEYRWDTGDGWKRKVSEDDLMEMIYDDEDYSAYEYESYHGTGTDNSFFSAMKIRLYGTEDTDLPFYYLEEMEEIDLAGCEIEILDGIEHCKYVRILDLSGNRISDISGIVNLGNIEELYLQDNQIGLIDTLYNLRKLRMVDLSGNDINDISPLFGLNNLEYVNILNNHVPRQQIEYLRQKDIFVVN